VSKYQNIISNLKKQVAELKEELANQSINTSMSKGIPKSKDTKMFDQLKIEMDQNFQKELENRKQYIDNEKSTIDSGMKMFQLKTEFDKSIKENGKNHVKTKQLEDSIKAEQKNIDKCAESRKKIDEAWENLKKYRDKLPSIWKKKKMKDMQLAMLQILLQNHSTTVENTVLKNKQEIEEGKAKAKDMELKCLHEIVTVKEHVIEQTKKQLSISKMELIIEDGEISDTPEIITKRMKMSFPTINFSTPLAINSKSRQQSVNVRIESKDLINSDKSLPGITSNSKHIVGSLKPLQPVIRNNYVSNARYGAINNSRLSKFQSDSKNTSSLPKLNIRSLDRKTLMRKPSIIIGQHPKKPYLNVKGPRKLFEKPNSPGGASITSEKTTTSLPRMVGSDTETSSLNRQPLSYSSAIKTIKKKSEIKAKDRKRLNRFKKENFIYNTSAKKLALIDKYKPIAPTNYSTPNRYINRVENPPSNIQKMEEKKEGSSIPMVSHSERMKNNMQKLNLLQVSSTPKPNGQLKGILKNPTPSYDTISSNLKANTLANSMSNRYKTN
jgi:hypothetical protein